ncbi:MAG: hypothetical protein WA664_16675 [Candidatus Acidiferrales bacterium]
MMARTKGKTIKSVEFENEQLAVLNIICDRERSTLSRILRIAADGFITDYIKQHCDAGTYNMVRGGTTSVEMIQLALVALGGKNEGDVNSDGTRKSKEYTGE